MNWFTILMVLCFVTSIWSQHKPDALWIPVTYYDFHSDGSNPEFECAHMAGVRTKMVEDTLDKDLRPVPGQKSYLNNYVKYWFREWKTCIKGDLTKPDYQKLSGGEFDAEIEYKGPVAVDYDTAFKNLVILDSLLFVRSENNIEFKYRNTNFFPLDSRGFGNEGKEHNYSFSMVLHLEYWGNYSIKSFPVRVTSDDDFWAYYDGILVIDLGGIHSVQSGAFTLHSDMQKHCLDLFFAERHSTTSSFEISLPAECFFQPVIDPPNFRLYADSIVNVGDSIMITVVQISGAPESNLKNMVHWRIVGSQCDIADKQLSDSTGDTLYFKPVTGDCVVLIECTLLIDSIPCRDTVTIRVKPSDITGIENKRVSNYKYKTDNDFFDIAGRLVKTVHEENIVYKLGSKLYLYKIKQTTDKTTFKKRLTVK